MKKKESVFGTLPKDELKDLITEAKKSSYKKALAILDLPVLRNKLDWFLEERRGYPYMLISDINTDAVLDIGAGSGIISTVLAKRFKAVFALEYMPELVQFIKIRSLDDGKNNIYTIRGDGLELPFQKKKFDLVVVNGVLEWVPDMNTSEKPAYVQKKFLIDINGVLKDGGKVAIAIENRFFFRHFLGGSPHGEPPFVAVLPRIVGDIISRKKLGKNYRNYIYSYWGAKRLLKKTGYKNIEILLLVPNYYNPRVMIDIKGKAPKEFFKKYFNKQNKSNRKNSLKKIIVQILVALNIWPYIEHSFLIIGEK